MFDHVLPSLIDFYTLIIKEGKTNHSLPRCASGMTPTFPIAPFPVSPGNGYKTPARPSSWWMQRREEPPGRKTDVSLPGNLEKHKAGLLHTP